MNFFHLAHAIMAYALGNMILIPVNAVIMGEFYGPQVLFGGVVVAAATAALHEIIETTNEF